MCETPEFGKRQRLRVPENRLQTTTNPCTTTKIFFPGKDVRFGNAYTKPHLSLSVRVRCHTGEYRALYQRASGFLNPDSPCAESPSCQGEQLYVSHPRRPQYNTKMHIILLQKI
jgi:hypothetical protein